MNSIRLTFLLALLFATRSVLAYENIRLTNDAADSKYPRIASDNDYCYVTWQDSRDGNWDIYWCKTNHTGQKLTADINVSQSSGTSSVPDIATDGLGYSYIAWQEGTLWGCIRFVRLDPAGNIVGSASFCDNPLYLRPTIVTNSSGQSYIVYERRMPGIHYLTALKVDTDGGILCSRELSNWDILDTDKYPHASMDPNGLVYVTWRDSWPDWTYKIFFATLNSSCGEQGPYDVCTSNDVYYPASTFIGDWFGNVLYQMNGTIQDFLGWECNRCQLSVGLRPAVDHNGSRSFGTWYRQVSGLNTVFMTRFDVCPSDWGDVQVSEGTGQSEYPDIAVKKDGGDSWFIVWQDSRDANWDIYYSTSLVMTSVVGSVYDDLSSLPLEGVSIELMQNGEAIYTSTSDDDGDYIFESVDSGVYDISFTFYGYEDYIIEDFNVVEGLNPVDEVYMTLLPLTVRIVYGLDQGEDAGKPVENAYLDIYRNQELLGTYGPTDESGILTLNSLEQDDEVYAFEIVGAGRTDKELHPEIHEYLMPDPIPDGCPQSPWRATYFNYIDNQQILDNYLEKYSYDGATRTFQLNHQIAKLDLVLFFDHPIASSDYDDLVAHIEDQVPQLNNFILDATNGLVMINSLAVYSNRDDLNNGDIMIQRARIAGKQGTFRPERSFLFPTYFSVHGPPPKSSRKSFDKSNYYKVYTHELGHYFLNLADEYEMGCKPDWIWECRRFCNLGFPIYHSSLMSDWAGSRLGITEFCYLNHDTYDVLEQNIYHESKSCWEYLADDWNSFELNIPGNCQEYLLGREINWQLPSGNYQEGPHLLYFQTTSHEVTIDFSEFNPSYSAENLHAILGFWPGLEEIEISIIQESDIRILASKEDLISLEFIGSFDETYADSVIIVYSVEPDQLVLFTADKINPVYVSMDTVIGEIFIESEALLAEDTFIDYIYAYPHEGDNYITFSLKISQIVGDAPRFSFFQDQFLISSDGMEQTSDSTFEITVSLDPLLSAAGTYLVTHESLAQIYLGRWEMKTVDSDSYDRLEFMDSYSIFSDASSFNDPILMLLSTTPIPRMMGEYPIDKVFPSSPVFMSISNPDMFVDSIRLGIFAGEQYLSDNTLSISKINPSSGEIEFIDVIFSGNDFYVYAPIYGSGLYMLASTIVDFGCVYTPGDCDHNGTPLELGDAIAMIGMYRGTVTPPYECSCPPHGDNFAPTADPNGNCIALELGDVVTEIAAYRGTGTASGCEDCPGSLRLQPGGEDHPLIVPSLKAKATKMAPTTQ